MAIDIEKIKRDLAAKDAAKQAELDRITAPLREKAEKDAAAKAKEKADAEKAQAEALQKASAAAFDAEHKPPALSAYLATGGTREGFEKVWPTLREELVMDAMRRGQDQARAAATRQYRQAF